MSVLENILQEIDYHAIEFESFGTCDDYISIGWVKDIIRKHLPENDGWVSIEERLPEEEAKKYIEKELKGIGYLYPCLLTYRSPVTERIHVVKFYYDIYEHFFVNNREEICKKERCIAWRPLPEPYKPENDEKPFENITNHFIRKRFMEDK